MTNVIDIYTDGDEDGRLVRDRDQVEWARTCDLLARWLPPPPAVVLDVGGGPGRYAEHLTGRGYTVTIYDLVPRHVEQAAARGITAHVADARDLPAKTGTADAVLLLGPLYHLPERADRASALAEAVRVLRPGGVLVATALSRWARVFVRAAAGQLGDPMWHEHTLTSMRAGHVEDGDAWDQVVYLHDVNELATELTAAGLRDAQVLGVEGPIGAWARVHPQLNPHALRLAERAEVALAATSIHLLATATAPVRPPDPGDDLMRGRAVG
ncbi:class I SAM-dependent methyltransferase [Luedemannella flava]